MVTPSSATDEDGTATTAAAARRRSFTSLWSNDDNATRAAADEDPSGGGRFAGDDDDDDGTWKDYEYDFADDDQDAQEGQPPAGVNHDGGVEDDNDTWAEYTLRDEGYDEEERRQSRVEESPVRRFTFGLNDGGGIPNLSSPKNNRRPASSRSLGSSSDNETLGENTLGGDTLVNLARAENDMDGMSLNEDEGNDVDTLAADTLTLVTEAQQTAAGGPAAAAIVPYRDQFGGNAPQRSQWALDDVVGGVPAGALVPMEPKNKNPSGIDIVVPSPDRNSAGGTEETASNSSGLRDYKYPGGGDFSLASSTPTRNNNGGNSNGRNRNRRNYRASGKVEDNDGKGGTRSSAFGLAHHILNGLRGKGGNDNNDTQRRGSERNLIRDSSPANYDDEEAAAGAGSSAPHQRNGGRGRRVGGGGFCGLVPELFRELPLGIRGVVVVALLTMIGSLAFLAVAGVRSGNSGDRGGDASSALTGGGAAVGEDGQPTTATFPPPSNIPNDAGGGNGGGGIPGQSSTPPGVDGNGSGGTGIDGNNTRTSPPDLTVGVYYYPWYTDANDFHGGRYLRKVLRPEQSPRLDEYSYDVGIDVDGDRDRGDRDSPSPSAVVRRHAAWSRRANVRLWVTSWWGPGSEEDRVVLDRILSHPDLAASPSSAANGGAGGGEGGGGGGGDDEIKIALHYETTNRLKNDDGDLDRDVLYEDVRYMVERYFGNYNYYRIEDKPVVFVHRTHDLSRRGLLTKAIKTMREAADDGGYRGGIYIVGDEAFGDLDDAFDAPDAMEVLDAVTDFDIYNSMGIGTEGRNHVGRDGLDKYAARQEKWRDLATGMGRGYVPGVIPGFNDRVVRYDLENTALSRRLESEDDESGSLFRALLRRAVQSVDVEKADGLIMINSWNEWHTDTQIEPVGTPGDGTGDGKEDGGEIQLSPRDVDGGGRIFDTATSTDLSPSGEEYTQGLRYESYGERYLDILREETVALLLA